MVIPTELDIILLERLDSSHSVLSITFKINIISATQSSVCPSQMYNLKEDKHLRDSTYVFILFSYQKQRTVKSRLILDKMKMALLTLSKLVGSLQLISLQICTPQIETKVLSSVLLLSNLWFLTTEICFVLYITTVTIKKTKTNKQKKKTCKIFNHVHVCICVCSSEWQTAF